jgi:L-alanine-DL-glutamate epimerase-like enolase superfamily enzyme
VTAIRALTADRVRIPFRRPFQTAHGTWREREAWIIRILDGDGAVGLGEAVLEPGADEGTERLLASLVREAAGSASAGTLPSRAELERHGVAGSALNTAIESALLDLDGRHVPPCIGPDGKGIGVNATIASLNAAAGAVAALAAVESGFTTLKVKAGDERDTAVLVDRVRAIRTAVGPAVKLRLDVNGAWDMATAEARLSAIAGFDIEYVEQPLPAGDADDLARLRRRVRVPIAADESVSSVAAVRGLLAAQAVDVVVVKLARVGGLAAAAEIAEAAGERGGPVVMSTLFETGIGIAAALHAAAVLPEVRLSGAAAPPAHGLATASLLEHDLLEDSLVVDRGRMRTAGGEGGGGLGIVLDRRALERFRAEAVGSSE